MTMVYVGFVTVTAVTMKITVFCDVISQASTDVSHNCCLDILLHLTLSSTWNKDITLTCKDNSGSSKEHRHM